MVDKKTLSSHGLGSDVLSRLYLALQLPPTNPRIPRFANWLITANTG